MYHLADLDGHCSGALARFFCEIEGSYPCMFPMNYGYKVPEEIFGMDNVVMLDFSLDYDSMSGLKEVFGDNFVWIDHHGPAINEMLELFIHGKQKTGEAACELAWKYYAPSFKETKGLDMPELVELLGRYDVWDQSDSTRWSEEILPFQYGMRVMETCPKRNYAWWQDRFKEYIYPGASAFENKKRLYRVITEKQRDGRVILEYQKQQDRKYMDAYAFDCKFRGQPAVAVNRGMINSRSFESVYNPVIHTFMIAFSRKSNGKYIVSVYSEEEGIHCGIIAKEYGGGGHAGAAGFTLSVDPVTAGVIEI
jgi:oligoribonuclease NrnB/cAMP/cGMP phosphodiesterase (DHH superfamily)